MMIGDEIKNKKGIDLNFMLIEINVANQMYK